MGGCYTQDSPFPQVCRSSRPFPPRSSKPPSNCLPVCLLKQVEPTPHFFFFFFFFFCSSGSCDAYSPFLRSRCCRCCFINSIFFFFFNSSASSYPLFSFFRFRSSSIFRLFFFNSSAPSDPYSRSAAPDATAAASSNSINQQPQKTDSRQKLSRNCSIFSLLLFLFSVLLQLLCFFRCLLFSFSCLPPPTLLLLHQLPSNSNLKKTDLQPHPKKKKTKTSPKTALFSASSYSLLTLLLQPLCFFLPTLIILFHLLPMLPTSSAASSTPSIQQLHKRILLQTNSTRELRRMPLVRKIPTREATAV